MVARTWRGRATAHHAEAYVRHFCERVVPRLTEIEGHRGAYLLKQEVAGRTEFRVVTMWESMERPRVRGQRA
jgi:heme-degrading monooxygenase HmoA